MNLLESGVALTAIQRIYDIVEQDWQTLFGLGLNQSINKRLRNTLAKVENKYSKI